MTNLQFGDWVEKDSKRYRYICNDNNSRECGRFVEGDNSFHTFAFSEVKHLPDCDSWKWQPPKPIDPPEGYRLLESGEKILATDKYLHCNKYWDDFPSNAISISIGEAWNRTRHAPMCRKIEPQYRPFANAAEFKPYRGQYAIPKDATLLPGYHGATDFYCDRGVYGITGSVAEIIPWNIAFERLQFEDGTPFGVKV